MPRRSLHATTLIFSVLFLLLSAIGCDSSKRTRNSENQTAPPLPTAKPIQAKLYLEASGSMLGYDGPTLNRNLKNTVTAMLNTFDDPTTVPVFIVNDSVYAYPKSYPDLIKSKSLFETKVGDASFTDFERIFRTLTTQLKEDELAILVTDLVYSDRAMTGQNAGSIQSAAQNLAQLALKTYAKSGSLLLLQMQSEFAGRYFPYNQQNKGITYRGNRPYYVLLFAKNATMLRLLTEKQHAPLRNFTDYPGFQNALLFSNALTEPYYTLLENDPDALGTFDKDRDHKAENANGLHAIKNVNPPHRAGQRLTLCVGITLPQGAYPEATLRNPKNYEILSPKDNFKLIAVKPSDGTEGTTHVLVLQANADAKGERTLTVKLKKQRLPAWVPDTHTDDDRNPKDPRFATTTFGLTAMITGVGQAYNAHSTDTQNAFVLTVLLAD
jgi:hypothetical protein